jgi:hypothetical protein
MEDDADDEIERLERVAAAHRAKIERLVAELDHRTHGVAPRVFKPAVVVAAVAGALALVALVWRRLRARFGG